MASDASGWLLFVRGQGARSLEAIRAVRKASHEAPGAPHVLKVIDVFREPELAEKYRVVATPTLVTQRAGSETRLVGDVCGESLRQHLGGAPGDR
jgi:circadian clock protein KaiB